MKVSAWRTTTSQKVVVSFMSEVVVVNVVSEVVTSVMPEIVFVSVVSRSGREIRSRTGNPKFTVRSDVRKFCVGGCARKCHARNRGE